MTKDANWLTDPVEGEEAYLGAEDEGGLTNDGKGGYITGQGKVPGTDGAQADEPGGGSSA